jgi:hypothetical protein
MHKSLFADTDYENESFKDPFLDSSYFEKNRARLEDITLQDYPDNIGIDISGLNMNGTEPEIGDPVFLDDVELVRQLEELYAGDVSGEFIQLIKP